jgi:hypothetical protein
MLVNRQKLCLGGSTEFELPKVTHWSANGWGLHFVNVEDEEAYREEQASTAQQQMEALKHRIFASFCAVLGLHITGMFVLSQYSSRFLFAPHMLIIYALHLSCILVLHMVPKRYPEHICCAAFALLQMTLLFSNPIRLHRLSLQKDVGPINEMWMNLGNIEFVESARDAVRLVWVGTLDKLFHQACDRIRTKLSVIKTLSVGIFFCSMLVLSLAEGAPMRQSSFCSTDHAKTHEETASDVCKTSSQEVTIQMGKTREALQNIFCLFFVLCSNWYSAYANERHHRENWALRRQAKHYEKAGEAQRTLEALLGLFCPVAVYVRGGQIKPDGTLAEQFGPGVDSLDDLPTETARGSASAELKELAEEITISRIPTKRNVVIRPRGGMQVFKCTVCAVITHDNLEILFGFQIHESYESRPGWKIFGSRSDVKDDQREPSASEGGSQTESAMAKQVDALTRQMEQLQDQMQEQMKNMRKRHPEPEDSQRDGETSAAPCKSELSKDLSAASTGGSISFDDRESMCQSDEVRQKRAALDSDSSFSTAEPFPGTDARRLITQLRPPSAEGAGHELETASSLSVVSREMAKPHRLSPSSLQDMRRVSKRLNCLTTWLRAVHSGHGQDLWRSELENKGLVVVHAPSPAEGAYILIPESAAPEDVVRALLQINLSVRRRTHFDEMNRANKSRVVFKCEPFTVSPTGDERPVLVRTTRFSQGASQLGPVRTPYAVEKNVPTSNEQMCDSSTSMRDGSTSGSLSLEGLAKMAPLLDRQSRNDYIDMTSDLGF